MKEYAAITRQKAAQPKFNPKSFEEIAVKEKNDHASQLALEAETRAEEARRKLFEAAEARARLKKAEVDAESTRVLIGLKEDNQEGLAAFKEGRTPVANPRAKAEALQNHDQETSAELQRLERKAAVTEDEAQKVQQEAVAIEKAAAEEKGEAEKLAENVARQQVIDAARENSAAKRTASDERRRKAVPLRERSRSRSRSRSKATETSSGSTAANAVAAEISASLQETLPVRLANSIDGLTRSQVIDAMPPGVNLNVPLLQEALNDSPEVQLDKLLRSGRGTPAEVEKLIRKINGLKSSKTPNKYDALFADLKENRAMIAKLMANIEALKGQSSRPVVLRPRPPPRIFVPRMTIKNNKSWFSRWFPRISVFFTRRSGGARRFQSRKNMLSR